MVLDAAEGITGGMSGSPILAEDGTAIGVICLGSGNFDDNFPTEGGPNPRLIGNLPVWFLKAAAVWLVRSLAPVRRGLFNSAGCN